MKTRPIQSINERRELRSREPHHTVADRRPPKRILLETLPKQHQAGSVPGQYLQTIRSFRAEDEDRPRERITLELLARERGKACRRPAGSPPASSRPALARRPEPRSCRRLHGPQRRCQRRNVDSGRDADRHCADHNLDYRNPTAAMGRNRYIWARQNRLNEHRRKGCAVHIALIVSRLARRRASRRQPNNCCGVRPCRRATAETFSPLS